MLCVKYRFLSLNHSVAPETNTRRAMKTISYCRDACVGENRCILPPQTKTGAYADAPQPLKPIFKGGHTIHIHPDRLPCPCYNASL